MDDLIERLRNFEGSDELGNGDFSLLHEAADALEEVQMGLRYAASSAMQKGRRAMTDRYENIRKALEMGPTPEFFLAEIVAQTNKRSLALAIRRELGEGYVITPGIDMLYAVRRLARSRKSLARAKTGRK